MKHIGINAKVASHVFFLLASMQGTILCLEIPLQSPPPPPGDRHLATVSPPYPGDRRALTREFARGAGGRRDDAGLRKHMSLYSTFVGCNVLFAALQCKEVEFEPKSINHVFVTLCEDGGGGLITGELQRNRFQWGEA